MRSKIVEVGEWLEEYGRVCKDSKVALRLGKGVGGINDTDRGGGWMYYVLDREVVAEKEGELINRFWSIPPPPPPL